MLLARSHPWPTPRDLISTDSDSPTACSALPPGTHWSLHLSRYQVFGPLGSFQCVKCLQCVDNSKQADSTTTGARRTQATHKSTIPTPCHSLSRVRVANPYPGWEINEEQMGGGQRGVAQVTSLMTALLHRRHPGLSHFLSVSPQG